MGGSSSFPAVNDRGSSEVDLLTVSFGVHINKKFGLLKPRVANLEVDRVAPARVKDLTDHLLAELGQINGGGSSHILLKAVCLKSHDHDERIRRRRWWRRSHSRSDWNPMGTVPLVCDEIWSSILTSYSPDQLEVLVHRQQHLCQVTARRNLISSCMPKFLDWELKHLDIGHFLPIKGLKGPCIQDLCQEIFEHGAKVSHDLRRGVWHHLLGVFHPDLTSREERERYMRKLRMVYDNLKGKLEGSAVNGLEKQQLLNAVYRDAIRTDTDNPFFSQYRQAESSYVSQHFHQSSSDSVDNVQKLINIVVIYTLEHEDISYTQGMTDILSPILYVMKNEADAYIAFAAMVERIKRHFGQWCSGTLHKLERFRHLCETLDPDLYFSITGNIEEDVFVLFFGMVLIECRREFSFQDSFHLLETIWAGEACMRNSFPSSSHLSHAQWARYMTSESPEVLQQVFEGSGGTYSAVPLPFTVSDCSVPSYQYSRNPSLTSCSPSQPVHTFMQRHSEAEPTPTHVIAEVHSSSSSSSSLVSPHCYSSSVSSVSHDSNTSGGKHTLPLSQPKLVTRHVQEDRTTQTCDEQADMRRWSLSDSNLYSLSSHSDAKYLRSRMVRKSASPRYFMNMNSGVGDRLGNQKLESTSVSRSVSELYDSFSNSKVMVVKPHNSKNHTEMSDMSSISSATTSTTNGNLISSLASINSRRSSSALARQESPALKNGTLKQEQIEDASETGSFERAGNSDQTLVSDGSRSFVSALSPGSGEDGKVTSAGEGSDHVATTETTNGFVVDHSHEMQKASLGGLSKRENCGNGLVFMPTDDVLKAEAGVPLDFSDDASCVLRKRQLHPKQWGDGGEGEVCDGVVEHRGMITNISNSMKFSLISPYGASGINANKDKSKSPQLLGRETPQQHRKLRSSPKRICGRVTPAYYSANSSPIHYDGEISSSVRVTPVAFFDTMDKLAKSVPSNRGPLLSSQLFLKKSKPRGEESEWDLEEREVQIRFESELDGENPAYHCAHHQRECSEIEASIMSQLILTDEGAPRVTREESLSIPFYECYSLFICLAILVQNRDEIMRGGADFYRLSEILNAQAGIQNLDETLRVAHELCRTYRKYQEACFKGSNKKMDCWLDSTQ